MMSGMKFCRIKGLTSAKGLTLNGHCGRVQRKTNEERIPVYLDGISDPMSIKQMNIEWLPDPHQVLESAVGRQNFRDVNCNALIVDHDKNRAQTYIPLGKLTVSGDACRLRGLLFAFREALQNVNKEGKPILATFCDLNVARLVSRLVTSTETGAEIDVDLHWDTAVQSAVKEIQRLLSGPRFPLLLTAYSPDRLEQDSFLVSERKGNYRHKSVLQSTFHFYPCNCPKYYDALEVRYHAGNSLVHEIWLDYGPSETIAYVKMCVAMKETERLTPETLAQVDPSAFWSCVVHYDTLVKALQESGVESDLMNDWLAMYAGIKTSRKEIVEIWGTGFLPDENGKWQIQNDQEHALISLQNARAAVVTVMMKAMEVTSSERNSESLSVGVRAVTNIRVEILDYYRGSEIAETIIEVIKACQSRDKSKLMCVMNKLKPASKRAGCVQCGVLSEGKSLLCCSRCKSIEYCSQDCQAADWRRHKKECKELAAARGPDFKAKLYKARSKLPTKPSMFSEVSGVGGMGILYSAGSGPSFINFHAGQGSLEDTINFNNLSELDPLNRFLLSCGPLPDLEAAKAILDDALSSVGNNVDKLRIKSAQFTALEWAAKKGNWRTVEWLCTDSRTMKLVNIGSPVGWAMYTGRVEISRYLISKGADPDATDKVLFGYTPPFLLAAQNGQLEAMKFLVNECGQDVGMRDREGRDALASIEVNPGWRKIESHAASHRWVKKKLAEQRRTNR